MLVPDTEKYCAMAKSTVVYAAKNWLETIEDWTPVVEGGDSKVAQFGFEGKYRVRFESTSDQKPGRCNGTCNNESQALERINLFAHNWLKCPNQAQREAIFEAIRNNHKRLRVTSEELTRSTETWEETCNSCNGRGDHPCTRCGLSGEVTCNGCVGRGEITCGVCNGRKGQMMPGDSAIPPYWSNCSACFGRGKQRCVHCNSSGKQRCPACNGRCVLDCNPCRATGHFTSTLTGKINLTLEHSVQVAADDERLRALASDVYTHGLDGRLPDFDPGVQMDWADNLVTNEVAPGTWESHFDGQMPFYFVDMRPDARFAGPTTTTIFAGRKFRPVSLGYIFDTTVHSLVTNDAGNILTGTDDIRQWASTTLGESIHGNPMKKTWLEAVTGISARARRTLMEGYDALAEKLKEPTKYIDLRDYFRKVFTYSAVGYVCCVAIGVIVLLMSASQGTPFAINWDIVGLGSVIQAGTELVKVTASGGLFSGNGIPFLAAAIIVGVVGALVIAKLLSGPKPWSKWKTLMVFLFSYSVFGGFVGFAALLLPQEVYYVFPENTSIGFLSALLSELLGVLAMTPDLLFVSALLAYARVRKQQDESIGVSLAEIGSSTMTQRMGFT